MAMSGSNMVAATLMPVLEKLTRNNHTLWRAQVLMVLRGTQLAEFLDGTNKAPIEKIQLPKKSDKEDEVEEVSNPAFELLKAQEQHVLSYLLTSVSHDSWSRLMSSPRQQTSGSTSNLPLHRNLVPGSSIIAWHSPPSKRVP
jgi:hypothetical protein